MKKALIITNTASMVHLFNGANIEVLQKQGYEVHVACNFFSGNTAPAEEIADYRKQWAETGVIAHHIGFLRSPFSLKSFKIYAETKKLIRQGGFDLIHCHTPIVSVFTRLAARKLRKNGKTKVIYTAHGFHFYGGAPLINWLIYYPIEKLMAPLTDVLVTINKEDHRRAVRSLRAKHVVYAEGVGVDTEAIICEPAQTEQIRQELGMQPGDLLITSVGELNSNKNHAAAMRALTQCKTKNVHYAVAGIGEGRAALETLAEELGLSQRVHLLGFRTDVYQLLKTSDIFVFPSLREGLSVALMEAMACGLPAVVSNIRGNCDLIDEGQGGILCPSDDAEAFAAAIDKLAEDAALRQEMGEYNKEKIKAFDKHVVCQKIEDILNAEQNEMSYEKA